MINLLKKLGLLALILLILYLVFYVVAYLIPEPRIFGIPNPFLVDYKDYGDYSCGSEYTNVFIDTNQTQHVVNSSMSSEYSRVIKIDFNNFTNKICFKLFDGDRYPDEVFEATLVEKEFLAASSYRWKGIFIDASNWKACFVNYPQTNKSFGKVFVRGRYYEVTPLENGLHLITEKQPGILSALFESVCNENSDTK